MPEQHDPDGDEVLTEVETDAPKENADIYIRTTQPYKPERIQELLRLVTIGDDLSNEEREKVRQLITSFADIRALSQWRSRGGRRCSTSPQNSTRRYLHQESQPKTSNTTTTPLSLREHRHNAKSGSNRGLHTGGSQVHLSYHPCTEGSRRQRLIIRRTTAQSKQ